MKNKILIIFLIFISLFILVGCTDKKEKTTAKKEVNVETEKDIYIKYVKKLRKVKESTEDLPFSVDVVYEKLKGEIRYQVVIDNPSKDITNIKALAIHDKQTDDVFPSVGIFDETLNLIPNEKPSGVILVGYIPYEGDYEKFETEMKVLISYEMDNEKFESYYVTKK